MKNKNGSEVVLKIIKLLYQQDPDMHESIYSLMIDVCREINVSPDKVFFILLLFAVVYIIMGYSRKIQTTGLREYNLLYVEETACENPKKIRGRIFSGDKKTSCGTYTGFEF